MNSKNGKSYCRPFRMMSLLLAAVVSLTVLNSTFQEGSSLSTINNVSTNMAYADLVPINKVRSGLVSSDSLTTGTIDLTYWTIYGSAVGQQAPYQYYEDSTGLHLGVQAKTSGTWAGLFAVSEPTSAQLFHAVLSIPSTPPADNMFDTALYIQTTQPHINSVSCAANVTPTGHYWLVGWGQGSADVQTQFTTLWVDTSPNQPSTRDCTIITNGDNLLKVYMDGALVYSANNLKLNVPSPFRAYLEPQTSSSSQMLFGTYRDYYTTSSGTVTVTNVSKGSVVKIVDISSNAVLASSKASGSGIASLDIAKYHLPLSNVAINVYNSQGSQVVASSSGSITALWGGDEYIVGSTPPPPATVTLAVSTELTTAVPLTGMWTTLSKDGQIIATGFSPVQFTLTSGQAYVVTVSNYGQYVFDHWKDTRSTNPSRTISISQNAQITAVYRTTTTTP